ncbi:Dual specificity protein phosphatase 10 [Linnemannia zychae]|nr:Dual specificity protein phosphatase 10 [Linnemannia zychae]
MSTTSLSPPPAMVRPTSHSFSLQRPLLAQDVKKSRNSKRLSLLVPPSPGKLESLAAMASASSPSFPPTSSLSSRRPFTPAPLSSTISSSTNSLSQSTSGSATATTDTTTRRHSQILLDQALPTPRLPLSTSSSSTHRPISAYFADFSVERGAASPYTSEPVCVLPHLFLGAEHNATDIKVLSRLGITAVLNVAVEIAQQEQQQEQQQQQQQQQLLHPTSRKTTISGGDRIVFDPISGSSIHYKSLSWTHHQRNLKSEFPIAFDFIEEAKAKGGKVLVHCQLGVSRSASLVIAYVMKTLQMGLTDAYELVKARSAVISPNMSLMYQLSEFEKSLNKSCTTSTKSPMYMDEDEEDYPYPTERMDLDSEDSAASSPVVVCPTPTKTMPPVTTRPRSSCYLSSTPIPQTPMTDRFSFSVLGNNSVTPVAAPSTVSYSTSSTTTMSPVPRTRLQLQSTPITTSKQSTLQFAEGTAIQNSRVPDMVYTPLSTSSNPVPPTPTRPSLPGPAFAAGNVVSSGISSRRQPPPSALSLSSSSSVSSFATSSYSRPSSTSSASSTSISQTIPDSPLAPTTPRSAAMKLTLTPTSSSTPVAPVTVTPPSMTTVIPPTIPTTPSTPSTPTWTTTPKTKKAAVIQSLASALTRRWSNHLQQSSSSPSASLPSSPHQQEMNQTEYLSSFSHQSSTISNGSDVTEGPLQGKMTILGQGGANSIPTTPATPNTTTTHSVSAVTATTSAAANTKEPEFIFSPRPCSPPLMETTRTFGEFYQALRLES